VGKTIWDGILAHWPATLYVPSILLILLILGVITRKWDDREQQRADVRGPEASETAAPEETAGEPLPEAEPIPVGVGAAAEVAPPERQAA
jgi:hypothetical protein